MPIHVFYPFATPASACKNQHKNGSNELTLIDTIHSVDATLFPSHNMTKIANKSRLGHSVRLYSILIILEGDQWQRAHRFGRHKIETTEQHRNYMI